MVNPPKDETVRIRKLLEKFGAVGDANVFYWFQNRRSRSRRRQRQMMQQQDPDNKFSFQIAFTANPTNLIKALSIVLEVTENSVNINFQFEMRMTWVDGKLQKGDPKPLAA